MRLALFIHQLPQNLLGLIVILFTKACKEDRYGYEVWITNRFNFGVSLGKFIILGEKKYRFGISTVKHEYGHQMQSIMLGWLYLFTVGIVSGLRNRYDAYFHEDWTNYEREKWYYGGFPEKQADRLGGVER